MVYIKFIRAIRDVLLSKAKKSVPKLYYDKVIEQFNCTYFLTASAAFSISWTAVSNCLSIP